MAHSRTEHISEDMFKSRTDFNDIDSPEIRGEIAGEPETPMPRKHSDIDGASALKVQKKKSEIVNLVKVKPPDKGDQDGQSEDSFARKSSLSQHGELSKPNQ